MSEHLAAAWLFLLCLALALFAVAALIERVGRRPAPVITDAEAGSALKTDRPAASGRGNQRPAAAQPAKGISS